VKYYNISIYNYNGIDNDILDSLSFFLLLLLSLFLHGAKNVYSVRLSRLATTKLQAWSTAVPVLHWGAVIGVCALPGAVDGTPSVCDGWVWMQKNTSTHKFVHCNPHATQTSRLTPGLHINIRYHESDGRRKKNTIEEKTKIEFFRVGI